MKITQKSNIFGGNKSFHSDRQYIHCLHDVRLQFLMVGIFDSIFRSLTILGLVNYIFRIAHFILIRPPLFHHHHYRYHCYHIQSSSSSLLSSLSSSSTPLLVYVKSKVIATGIILDITSRYDIFAFFDRLFFILNRYSQSFQVQSTLGTLYSSTI